MDLFEAATSVTLRDGRGTDFWEDPWIQGRRLKDYVPLLFVAKVPGTRSMLVAEGVERQAWVNSVSPNLCNEGILQFLALWEHANQVFLTDGEDSFHWMWSPSGVFSARSAYLAFFAGRIGMDGADPIWDSKAPTRCKFFVWLVCRRRCWTADRLQRRGLDHTARCPLCDQEQETIDHLLLGCVMAREV